MGWRGCLVVFADTAVHLCSVSFHHSPSGLGGRQRTLHLLPGSSDHRHPEHSKGAANITMHPAITVLLVLLSQAEVQLFSRERLQFKKAGTRSLNPGCLSQVELTGSKERAWDGWSQL